MLFLYQSLLTITSNETCVLSPPLNMMRSSLLSCGPFVILALQEEKCDLGPSAVIKAISTTELMPDWLTRVGLGYPASQRKKAIPCKDFPAHYFPTSSLSPLKSRFFFTFFFFLTTKPVFRLEPISSTKGH